jgi:RHS repeat-associated protein
VTVHGDLPQLLTETEGGNTTHYLYGPGDQPYAQIANDTTTTTYLHHDQLGSTRLLTDSTGTQTGAATYDEYGAVAASSGTLSHLGYAGQYTDSESGTLYLRVRYLDATTGQFLTKDPVSPSTRIPYAYAADSPTNFGDPTGLKCAELTAARPCPAPGADAAVVSGPFGFRLRVKNKGNNAFDLNAGYVGLIGEAMKPITGNTIIEWSGDPVGRGPSGQTHDALGKQKGNPSKPLYLLHVGTPQLRSGSTLSVAAYSAWIPEAHTPVPGGILVGVRVPDQGTWNCTVP